MDAVFHVKVSRFSNIWEIEGARSDRDFAAMLDAMEYGDQSDLSDVDRRDLCVASLQERTPAEAAYVVLKHDMGDVLRDGQIRNAAGEMADEKLWEEFADSSLHEKFFNSGSLLYEAFPQVFPTPDAVRVELEVTPKNSPAEQLLSPPLNESFLARLLADGMDSHAPLHRLYGDELEGTSFPNAAEVVWIVDTEVQDNSVTKIDVVGSGYWLDALAETKSYESHAYRDTAKAGR